jgi:beta-lactamase class A
MIGTTMALTNHSSHKPAPAPAVAEAAPQPEPKPASPVASKPAPDHQELQQLLDKFVVNHPGSYGIWVKDLKTGQQAGIKAEQAVRSASLYKLFVAFETYKQIDAGKRKLGDAAGGGTKHTVKSCLEIMINVSDNPCGSALGDKLGWSKLNPTLKAQGFTATSLKQPHQTSAADTGRLLEMIYRGDTLSAASNAHFLVNLKAQKVRNRLPQGLPAGTVIAHKTGDLYGYMHDAGIVYGPKTDYLVVITSGPWETPATAAPQFASLSKQLYAYFNR